MRQLGPGLIIAGSVVGSGELIATTIAGAEAGFWLLWLILAGCFIKVFVQLEVGKCTIITYRTTLEALCTLPGWKPRGLHWIAWMALLMFVGGIGQMGGVAGGVGQALSIAQPLTEQGRTFNEAASARVQARLQPNPDATQATSASAPLPPAGSDVLVWTLLVSVITAGCLYAGRYGLIEITVMVMVILFTLMSLANVLLLQRSAMWAIGWGDLWQGLRFQLPPNIPGLHPVATALAAFGIIGMAAGEIIFYPYWCREKGYAAHVGKPDGTEAWQRRAHGWIRVMHWDAWCSMLVYTLSTVGFYLLGAAVLNRVGLHPQGLDLIRALAAMYEPVFGDWAVRLFLVGAVAVLYSTFFVNNASSALVWTDLIRRLRGGELSEQAAGACRRGLSAGLPLLSFILFWMVPDPRGWVIFAGMSQTLMLPLLGYAAVHFRFQPEARAFRQSRVIDGLVVLSALALTVAGGWLLLTLLFPGLSEIG